MRDHPLALTAESATADAPYRSFWMAGFEGADHINGAGERLDMVAASGHERHLDADYARLARLGVLSVRESIGWRLAEPSRRRGPVPAPQRFDFARTLRFAAAARRHGVQVLWSLMHYGTPDEVSLLDDSFCQRLAEFAGAVARTLRPLAEAPTVYTPINEINFLAWAASSSDILLAYGANSLSRRRARAQGHDLGWDIKRRLVRGCLMAMDAIRAEDRDARFLHVEPLIHVATPVGAAEPAEAARTAEAIASWQWQAWDMLRGTLEPQLGGRPEALDLLGLNYYHNSQWDMAGGGELHWHRRDPRRRPMAALLRKAAMRYGKPLIVAETSHVGAGRAEWLGEVTNEVLRARGSGTPVHGICLYPIVDRPDWSQTERWHQSGLWQVDASAAGRSEPQARRIELGYAKALRRAQRRLPGPSPAEPGSSAEPPYVNPETNTMPHLLVFSHLRWNFVFQRPQHLLSRLAREFPVVFVEEPMRCDGPAWLERSSPVPGVEVLRPHTPVEAWGFHDDQLSLLEPLIGNWLANEGIDDYAAWFYTPMALPLLNGLSPRAVIYDCMDELSAFHNAPRQMRQRETALLKRAELVLTGGPSLYEAKRTQHPHVLCLPSAVDAAHYAHDRAVADAERMQRADALQGGFASPRLGFFGVIDERLDIGLVAAIADADPSWQVVMAGPVVKIDPARLPQRPNLHWLGQQPYELLPQLVAGWSVCLMPFALNDSTRFISPTKTLEYMAAGKPVVSTRIRDVEVMFGDLVTIADEPTAFVAACREALAETDASRTQRESAMAARVADHAWDATAKTIRDEIVAVLAAVPATPQPTTPAEAGRPAALAAAQPAPAVAAVGKR